MLTSVSIIDSIKAMSCHGEGQHYFDGRHKKPHARKKVPKEKKKPRHSNLRIRKDKKGHVYTYSAKTDSYSWLEIIRIR